MAFAEEFHAAVSAKSSLITIKRTWSISKSVHRLLAELLGSGTVELADGLTVRRPMQLPAELIGLRGVQFPKGLSLTAGTPVGTVYTTVKQIELTGTPEQLEVLVTLEGTLSPSIRIKLVVADDSDTVLPDDGHSPIADRIAEAVTQAGVPQARRREVETWLLRAHSHGMIRHHIAMTTQAKSKDIATADKRAAKRLADEMRQVGIIPGGIILWLTIGKYVIQAIMLFIQLQRGYESVNRSAT